MLKLMRQLKERSVENNYVYVYIYMEDLIALPLSDNCRVFCEFPSSYLSEVSLDLLRSLVGEITVACCNALNSP